MSIFKKINFKESTDEKFDHILQMQDEGSIYNTIRSYMSLETNRHEAALYTPIYLYGYYCSRYGYNDDMAHTLALAISTIAEKDLERECE